MERKANQSAGGGILHDYCHQHHNYHQHHHSHHHHHHYHQNRHSMQWWWRLTRGSRVVWPEALGAEPSLAEVLRLSSDWVGEIRTEKPHENTTCFQCTHKHMKCIMIDSTHTHTHTHLHTHTHTIHHNHSAQKHTLDFTPITVRQNGTKHTEIHHASSRLFHYCVTMAVQPLQWTWYHCTAVGSLTAERDKTHTGNTPCSLYTPPLLHSELICWRVFHQ